MDNRELSIGTRVAYSQARKPRLCDFVKCPDGSVLLGTVVADHYLRNCVKVSWDYSKGDSSVHGKDYLFEYTYYVMEALCNG